MHTAKLLLINTNIYLFIFVTIIQKNLQYMPKKQNYRKSQKSFTHFACIFFQKQVQI